MITRRKTFEVLAASTAAATALMASGSLVLAQPEITQASPKHKTSQTWGIIAVTDNGKFYDVPYVRRQTASSSIDVLVSLELTGGRIDHFRMGKYAYRALRQDDSIQRVVDQDGQLIMMTFLGYRVRVPGTALA